MPVTSNFASLKMAPEKNCLKLVKEKVELFVPSTFVELAAHIKEIVKYMKRLEMKRNDCRLLYFELKKPVLFRTSRRMLAV